MIPAFVPPPIAGAEIQSREVWDQARADMLADIQAREARERAREARERAREARERARAERALQQTNQNLMKIAGYRPLWEKK